MKGAITFLVILSHQLTNVQLMQCTLRPGANVLFELFPQACGDCSEKGEAVLCPPKWYPEEVDKVALVVPLAVDCDEFSITVKV